MPNNKKVATKRVVVKNIRELPSNASRKKQQPRPRRSQPAFGPVATIDTAPVSIGNTFSGAKPIVIPMSDGVRIKGRDFLVNVANTASTITGWTLVGGAPITPGCMISGALKGYNNSYAKYMINAVAFHYITACTTSDAGSIMVYIGKERSDPALNTSNANFLPVVLSDPHTIISPVWKNCSAVYAPNPVWYPTDTLSSDGLHEQCPGEFFIYTRIPSVDIPGYVIMDYDITFTQMQVNVKSLTFPIARMKYTNVCMTTTLTTASQAATYTINLGTLLDGTTTSAAPLGAALGDVYKIIYDKDSSTFSTALESSYKVNIGIGGTSSAYVYTAAADGFTMYGVLTTVDQMVLYSNYAGAIAGADTLLWTSASSNPSAIQVWMSLVGSVGGQLNQANY